MTAVIGESLGPYYVVEKLGEGGMGEVYRARDTRLDRDVAIKVSATEFSERFTREARSIAALNHSNICHLYDVGPDYLVLEYVEGAHPAGPMSFEQALPIILQLIDGIEAAHEKNIIHRDLKTANIKITTEGVVKILDFGLAKAAEPEGAIDPGHSPTFTMGVTQAGVILGTAAYMAPEQARGKVADRRSDIWSFGVVVYELLVGRAPFEGESAVDILGAVVNNEPDWSVVPPRARRLLQWCLQKDRRKRLAAIADARALLDESEVAAPSPVVVPRRRRLLWPLTSAVLAIASAVFAYGWWRASRPVARPLTRLSVDLGGTAERLGTLVALVSPDGTRLVHPVRAPDGTAVPVLAVRRLDGTDPVILGKGSSAFWSADSRSVAFIAGGALVKVAAEGGVAVRLASVPGGVQGGSWSDGLIVVGTDAMGLFVVPEAGGTLRPLTSLEAGEATHRYPQLLPGGSSVLFTANASNTGFESARIKVVSVATGQQKTIITGGYFGRFVPSGNGRLGHVLFIRGGALHAAVFDVGRLEVIGEAVPVVKEVGTSRLYGAAFFGASNDGALVFARGEFNDGWRVERIDEGGRRQPLIRERSPYTNPRFSPDGRRLAVVSGEVEGQQILVYDTEREVLSRINTGMRQSMAPVWSPDSRYLVFSDGSALYWMRADGGGMPRRLLAGNRIVPSSISADGRWLAFSQRPVGDATRTDQDVWTVALDVTDPERPTVGKPEPFVQTPAMESEAAFSPDGRWLAYASSESGTQEVYVRPFPILGDKWQVSSGSGHLPMWSKSAKQLVYQIPEPDSHVMVVDYTLQGSAFAPGKPRRWSEVVPFDPGIDFSIDLAPDGRHIAVLGTPDETVTGNLHVTFLLNFFDELRRLVPLPSR